MPKINVLDKHVAELIAAGEVVERPASIIKELVENSVDAGATALTVEIRHGGISFIRVTDNGCGISREDVPLAFVRHATSKVHWEEDLEAIGTLGFRGEALASIAAVARVEMLTRTENDLAGTRYIISGGEEESCDDAGCAKGTTLVIRDIFYNTPARMKFLKKDVTEANAIAAVMDRMALSHPEVSVRFLRDGKETLNTPGDGKLKSAVYAVFGKEFTSGLLPVTYTLNGIEISGFISKPANARPNRSMQHFFINGRYVKSRTMQVALEESFKGSLMVGKVPACVLHISLPPEAVDVNVHPAKIEVRFINEKPIFEAVYHGVKSALNEKDSPSVFQLPKPSVSPFHAPEPPEQTVFTAPASSAQPSAPILQDAAVQSISYKPKEPAVLSELFPAGASVQTSAAVARPASEQPEIPEEPAAHPVSFVRPAVNLDIFPEEEPEEHAPQRFATRPQTSELEQPAQQISVAGTPDVRLIGEAFGTYILLERGDELVLIDKHAAHERMLYEQLKEQAGDADRQMLLAPIPVTLDKNEYAVVLESLEIYAKAGFEMEDFGSGTVLVRTAPLILGGEDVAEAVMEIAGYLHSAKNDISTEKLDWLYHNVACRAAVKAGDESSPQELYALAQRLAEHPEIRYCPHGRPVSYILRRKDLEKQFGRI